VEFQGRKLVVDVNEGKERAGFKSVQDEQTNTKYAKDRFD
jgi:hypothetical protein